MRHLVCLCRRVRGPALATACALAAAQALAAPEAAGRWEGIADVPGNPLRLVVDLDGKRTATLDVDQVAQGREFVTLRASAANCRIEGRLTADGAIEGTVIQGPFEAAIVLRRVEKAS